MFQRVRAGRGRGLAAAVATVLAAAGMTTIGSGTAHADTAPVAPETRYTVAADALPTVQINGVVWAQVIVGNRVYATGQFTKARPAGAAAGTNETTRSNILAYDLTTGALVTSWAPSLDAQGLAIAASPDGSRIYVGGDFTTVNGTTRKRVAALDATTGALVTGFAPTFSARVKALAVTSSTLYVGGSFTTTSGQSRTRLAAVTTANGAVTSWAPTANGQVTAMTIPSGTGTIVVGGRFTTLNGQNNYGLGALNLTTGAVAPFAANSVVRNAGDDASITSLSSDGGQVYGTGYTFGAGGNLESAFAASANGGSLVWVSGCKGDTYDGVPIGSAYYTVSHAHDCSSIGANPQTNPWTYQRAYAFSTARGQNNKTNSGGTFWLKPAPDVLHWLPTLEAGTYTGQTQAAWSVKATSKYVVLGGEFPKVNGTAQQGLVRFAVKEVSTNKQGPQAATTLTPTLKTSTGKVTASFTATWDRDNRRLTYELLRGATAATATVAATTTLDSTWWNKPKGSLVDTGGTTGTSTTYRIRAKDAFGNSTVSSPVSVTFPAGGVAAAAVGGAAAVAPGGVLASDSFTRTVANGLGTADNGGNWTVTGGTTSVTGDAARVSVAPGARSTALLGSISSTRTEAVSTVWTEQAPTGSGAYLSTVVRSTVGGEYRARVRVQPSGAVQLALTRDVQGTETILGSEVAVPGILYTPGMRLVIRVQASGTSPTTVSARVWADGTAEPTAWQRTATDSTAGLQTAGGVGQAFAVPAAAQATTTVFRFDGLTVTAL